MWVFVVVLLYLLKARYGKFGNAIRIGKLVHGLLIIVHGIACGYNAISQGLDYGTDVWVVSAEIGAKSTGAVYLYCIYWSAASLTGLVDYAATPQTTGQEVFSLVIIALGIFVIATVIADVGSLVANLNANAQVFRNKMDLLNMFMTNRRIPIELRHRIQMYYDHLWSKQQGLDDTEILKELPTHLQTSVARYLNSDIISSVPFFQESVPGFISSICIHLKSQVYVPDEAIFQAGDVGREMFFIKKGRVRVVSREGKILTHLSDGQYFGEIALLMGGRRTASGRIL